MLLDLGQLILPVGLLGLTITDATGAAHVPLPIPPLPQIQGLTLFAQWIVADPAGTLNLGGVPFAATPGRTLILW